MCKLCNVKDEDKIREYGKAFGYPDCCIEEYIRDTELNKRSKKDVRNKIQIKIARKKHGFVPCKKHAAMIERGQVTAEELVAPTRDAEKAAELNKWAVL